MNIYVNEEIAELANIFSANNSTLYIVGGYIRDSLLGRNINDLDVCSNLTPEQVSKILKNNDKYNINRIDIKLGSVLISSKNTKINYTTFRTDVYKDEGSHFPCKVRFVNTIKKDYKRRDFKINSIYFDIIKNKIIDPSNGIKDLKNNIINEVISGKTIKQDAVRILRAFRFSVNLKFDISKKTNMQIKKYFHHLDKLSRKRIIYEFEKFIESYKYSCDYILIKDFILLGGMAYIFPEICDFIDTRDLTNNYEKIVFEHFNKNKEIDSFVADLCLIISNINKINPKNILNRINNGKNANSFDIKNVNSLISK